MEANINFIDPELNKCFREQGIFSLKRKYDQWCGELQSIIAESESQRASLLSDLYRSVEIIKNKIDEIAERV